ncbi:DUF4121 family protein [Brevibacillus sp. NPDC058079]|uniref:DUF4121 family protein n=1 Tax=Brevibacillus sp. NPDC058079 TaxID=3346330 RepID=UPI0036E60D43
MNKYTIESLKALNPLYDNEHGITQADVDNVNQMVELIENSRNNKPQIGDIVEYTSKYGDYYGRAHIETIQDDLYICEQPYIPFVGKCENKDTIYTSTSGGAWTHIPNNLQYVGAKEKSFVVWGHSVGNGSVLFHATINVWTYTEGSHEFTTKTHDKFYVSILKEADEYGYGFLIRKEGVSHTAFQTKGEYQAWLKTYRGVEKEGSSNNNKIAWTIKQESRCVPLEEYKQIQNAIIDSELCNGTIQECKRIYEETSVVTYLPYQNDRIQLKGAKRYMKAYES